MDVCKLTLDNLKMSLRYTMSQLEDDYKPTLVSLHTDILRMRSIDSGMSV